MQGAEKLDGVDCYVIKLTPDMNQLFKMMMSQMQSEGLPSMESLDGINLADMIKNTVVTIWIARDSRLLMREDVSMDMDFNARALGLEEEGSGRMNARITATVKFLDYNQPVSIVLPPEAAGAVESPAFK